MLFTYGNVQTEQMSRIVNELDSINFSIKKASKLVKEIGRQVSSTPTSFQTAFVLFFFYFCSHPPNFLQVATDKCIMALLFMIVLGVIAIIIVKVDL